MLSVESEEVLDQLYRAQNRLFVILATGFVMGFLCGLVAAWLMVSR